jgi:hypothetical protein
MMAGLDSVPRLLFFLLMVACGSADPTGAGGSGTLSFTTWGEDYIEQEIPVDPGDGSGFVDGWSVRYAKFLVNFQNIVVADAAGRLGAKMAGSKLFDNKLPDPKPIVDFRELGAKAWSRVSYEIAPVTAATELSEGVDPADKALMLAGTYSLYVEASARKDGIVKHFAWGFAQGTLYDECRSQQGGQPQEGVIVTNNTMTSVELTTHGDHLFYDRLQASADPNVKTSLRFEAIAEADRDGDDQITLEELNAVLLDVRRYNPSGLGAATLGAFVTSLARTIGHFRGEGECTTRKL